MDAHAVVVHHNGCEQLRASTRSLPDYLQQPPPAPLSVRVKVKQRPREMGAPGTNARDERMKSIESTHRVYFKHGSSSTTCSPVLSSLASQASASKSKSDSRHRSDVAQSSAKYQTKQQVRSINKWPSAAGRVVESTCQFLWANSRDAIVVVGESNRRGESLKLEARTSENETLSNCSGTRGVIMLPTSKQTSKLSPGHTAGSIKWKQRPRPKSNWCSSLSKVLFLSKMPSPLPAIRLLATLVLIGLCCFMPTAVHSERPLASDNDELRANSDLLSIIPPFAPTRRPLQLLHGTMPVANQRDVQQMPNNHHMNQMQQTSRGQLQPQVPSINQPHEQAAATAASSTSGSKFTRTNELDGFLDEMNHKELQTVAAGRPIEDLFQPKPFNAPTSPSHASHHHSHPKPAVHHQQQPNHHHDQREMGGGAGGIEPPAATGPSGLMGSHSEQQIYSDCALILQRTYVKNIEDPKHQMVPFGKTEQACISYKHIDKAVEQAKHKLKFREFAKMRKKAAAAAAAGPPAHGQSQAPPPPFEVIHSSLEPPEDLVAAIGEINMAATQIIADQFDLSNDELLNGLPLIDMSKTKFWNICPLLVRQDIKCELTRFRTFTGHCNNLKHPTWGAAKTPYARYLPPVHPDGIWVPRKSIVSEVTFGHAHPEGDHSMPPPTHHMDDDEFPGGREGDATSVHASGAPSPHRLGHHNHQLGSENSIDNNNNNDDDEALEANLAHAADAELLRESRDDGSHMDMAGSVQFERRARIGGGGGELAPGASDDHLSLAAHQRHLHHQQLMAASQAHAHQHHPHHGGPPRPPMPFPAGTLPAHGIAEPAAATAALAVHRARSMPQELPSARLVSSVVHRDVDAPNHDFTMLFMSWGQLLDHDMTRAATPPNTIKCCPGPNGEPASKHKLCLPIEVPQGDPFYSKFGVQCLDFRRTLAGVRPNCVLGPRVHQNANTAPIDANFVYGSAHATADSLRLFKGGRLRDRDWFRQEGLKPLLPAQEIDPDLSCLGRPRDLFCFLAGDVRVNEQTHLTVLHTLYMREHNRIADRLSELNPHWDDERTFQETRHLMAAGVQHVLINEYIPLLIGRKMTELYNLTVATPTMSISNHHAHAHHHHHIHQHHSHERAAYWHGYDSTVTTSVSNSFAAAAFRQGHTFVQSTIDRFNKFHEFVSSEKLRHLFMRPFLLYQPGVMDELVSGMINRQSQSYDPFMTEELAGHLFQPPEAQFGHDLASINLQRGRDQGLPGYNLFREWCGLPRAETFEQLEPYLTNRTAYLYSKLYKHVDDIDLWSAGIAERKLPGAAIGPTFSCIIARQFSNTRRGDRFWYENPGLPSSFTPDQLSEIKKFTLAKLICTNADDLPTIQRWAFRMAHPVLNPRVDCSQLPDIDLQYWQEE